MTTAREVYAQLVADHGGPTVPVPASGKEPELYMFPDGAMVSGGMNVRRPPADPRVRLRVRADYHTLLSDRCDKEAGQLAAALHGGRFGRPAAVWNYPRDHDWLHTHLGPPSRSEPGESVLARLRALAAENRAAVERIEAELAADLARGGRPAVVV